MRIIVALFVCILGACATAPKPSVSDLPSAAAAEEGTVTYFDRNHDAVVDLEFHNFGCCDRNWARSDSDFDGRFDLQIEWGYSFEKNPIDVAVPSGVPISSGESKMPTWP